MTNAKPPFLDIRQTTTTRVSLRQQKSKERGRLCWNRSLVK
jgi:hypothetical protein